MKFYIFRNVCSLLGISPIFLFSFCFGLVLGLGGVEEKKTISESLEFFIDKCMGIILQEQNIILLSCFGFSLYSN